jgi:hypothetical protein
LRESDQSKEIEQQQRPVSPVTGAQSELDQIQKEAREEWLRQQRTQQSSLDPNDRSAEKDQEAKPKDLSGIPDKGLDDDLN